MGLERVRRDWAITHWSARTLGLKPSPVTLHFFFLCSSQLFSLSNGNTNVFIHSAVHYWLPIVCPEKAMATHSSTLAWEIPWTEEPGRLQSMGSRRVGQDWATSLSLFTFMHWRRNWEPTPICLPGESQGQEPGGLLFMGSHRVGHDWCDLTAVYILCTCDIF